MKIPSFNDLIRSRLLITGLVFLGVNLSYSYMFYQVNSYKIAVVLIGISMMVVWYELIFPVKANRRIHWKEILILVLPIVATLPGLIWHQGAYNYNFKYEFATNLCLVVWAIYLIRGTKEKNDLFPLIFFIGITIIYVGLWAFLEKLQIHPLDVGVENQGRVKSTFGNVNYFAGFLVLLIPLFVSLSLPGKINKLNTKAFILNLTKKSSVFIPVVLAIAGLSIFFTQTRAALAATTISIIIVAFFYFLNLAPSSTKKPVLIGSCIIVIGGIAALFLAITFVDYLPQNRYTNLLTIQGWAPRFAGWAPAISSIKFSPIFGFGLGSSYNLYFSFLNPDARLFHYEHSYNHVHNEILEYLQEAGFVGLAIHATIWVYLVICLFKVFYNQHSDPLLKKIAIGIFGGFMGYHFHSLFSVAPRMMVVKLPLYTLIGLTFVVSYLSKNPEDHPYDSNHTIKWRTIAPMNALVVFIWVMFSPWLIGQYKFSQVMKNRSSLSKAKELERIVENYPDIYALEFLSRLQIQLHRIDELQKTFELIDREIPNYRELGYSKAVSAVLKKDHHQAKRLALEYQNNQDRYHKPTILLLMNLSFETNDYPLFKQQFKYFIREAVFKLNMFYSFNAGDVKITIKADKRPVRVIHTNEEFSSFWDEKLIRDLFNAGRKVRSNLKYSNIEKITLNSFLFTQIQSQPYFQLNVKPEFISNELAEINQYKNNYFVAVNQKDVKSTELSKIYTEKLKRASKKQHQSILAEQNVETEKALSDLNKRIDEISEFLSQRSNWDEYLKRRSFAHSIVSQLVELIFPSVRKT